MNLDLAKFNPNLSELKRLSVESSQIVVTDLKDKVTLVLVKTKRKELQKARTTITKTGKLLRDDAKSFRKLVLDKEKELLAIILPEEERLKQIVVDAKELAIKEKRLDQLQERKKRLTEVSKLDEPILEDESILSLDDEGFENYYNACVSRENERIQAELDEEKRKQAE